MERYRRQGACFSRGRFHGIWSVRDADLIGRRRDRRSDEQSSGGTPTVYATSGAGAGRDPGPPAFEREDCKPTSLC